MQNNLVRLSNSIVTSKFKLSTSERRVLMTIISKIDPTKGPDRQTDFTISYRDLWAASNEQLEPRNCWVILDRGIRLIKERKVFIDKKEMEIEDKGYIFFPWVNKVETFPQYGQVQIFLNPELMPFLTYLGSEFTQTELYQVLMMENNYAFRIYLLCMKWKSRGWVEHTIPELMEMLDLPASYSDRSNFRRKVINPVTKEINDHTDMDLKILPTKRGKKINGYRFSFSVHGRQGFDPEKLDKGRQKDIISELKITEREEAINRLFILDAEIAKGNTDVILERQELIDKFEIKYNPE